LSMLTADHVIALLKDYARQTGATVDILLVGALALQAYGYQDRLTSDVDAEVVGSVEALAGFFSRHQLPADLPKTFPGGPLWRCRQGIVSVRPTSFVRIG
jgi:hypothetical protein